MTKRPKIVVKQRPSKCVADAVAKVIQNPNNSKTAKIAAGRGLAHRPNHVSFDSNIRIPLSRN